MIRLILTSMFVLLISSCKHSERLSDSSEYINSTQDDCRTSQILNRLSKIHISSIKIEDKNLGDSMHLLWKSYKKSLDSPRINFVVMYKAKYLYGENEDYEKKAVSVDMKNTNLSAVINKLCLLGGFKWKIEYDKPKMPFVLIEPKEKQNKSL